MEIAGAMLTDFAGVSKEKAVFFALEGICSAGVHPHIRSGIHAQQERDIALGFVHESTNLSKSEGARQQSMCS